MNAINMSLPGVDLSPPAPPLPPLSGGAPKGLPPLGTVDMDAYLDQTVFDNIEIVINSVIINALSIVGSAGNILCIYILYIHGFSSSTNVILVSLAVADLLILLTLPLRKISLIIEPFDKALSITVESYVVCYHLLTLNRVWSLISNAHVALIAVERFLAVFFPFKVSQWTTVSRMIVTVITLHVIFYILLIPLFAMFRLMWVFDPNLNATIAIPSLTDFFLAREEQIQFYNSYIVNLLLGALFLVITLFCCVAICIKLVIMSKKRKFMIASPVSKNSASTAFSRNTIPPTDESKSALDSTDIQDGQHSMYTSNEENVTRKDETASSKNQQSVTVPTKSNIRRIDIKVVKLLLIVCIVYLVLIFPSFLLFVFQEIYEELREPYWRRVNFLATSVSMLLIALNSSLNFVIYVINSQKFYETFTQLISRKKVKKVKNFK